MAIDTTEEPQQPIQINTSIPLGPTQERFIICQRREVCIGGSRREGKSFAGYTAMLHHALRQDPRKFPIPWVICRDTATNLHRTTVPGAYKWEQQCKQAMCEQIKQYAIDGKISPETAQATMHSIRSNPWVRLTKRSNTEVMWLRTGQMDEKGRHVWPVMAYLFGMDQLKDISRFQSMELGGGWVDEPAPAAEDDIGGGIQEIAWMVMLTSLNYEVDVPRAQITMNPPDEDHWTWRRFVSDNDDPDNRVFFHIPVGENKYLPQWYRDHIDKALKSRPDLHRRLVQGLPGFVQKGKPVAPNFSEEAHISKVPLTFSKFGKDLHIGWDFGSNPSALGMQQTSTGHFNFLFAFTGENMGVRQFIDNILRPYMATHIPSVTLWHIGDPQGQVGSEVDITSSPVQEILRKLGGYWRPGPQKWEPRREAVHNSLTAMHLGRPLVQFDKSNCSLIIKSLKGAWHYPEVGNGRVAEVPRKDFACVDEKTEIMTAKGFKRYTEINEGDEVYGFDMRLRRIVPDRIEKVHAYNHKHYGVYHFGNRESSMVVTPEHKIIACHGTFNTGGPIRWDDSGFVEASKINSTYGMPYVHGLMDEYRHRGRRVYSNSFVRLCAWVMAEGHYRKDGSGEIWISQSEFHDEYCKQLRELSLQFPNNAFYRYSKTAHGRTMNLVIRHELADHIRKLMPYKYPSFDMISNMRANERLMFIFEAAKGDGSHTSGCLPVIGCNMTRKVFWGNFRGTSLYICASSQQEADAIQYLCAFSGLRTRQMLHDRHHNDFRVSIKRYRNYFSFCNSSRDEGDVDTVWCPQTTTSTWIARRNGFIFPTGNSHIGDCYGYMMAVLMGERAPVRKDLRVRTASYSKMTPQKRIAAGMLNA